MIKDERIDEIGFGGLKLIQKPEEFCFGVDAVLLADFAVKTAKQGQKVDSVIDLGTGTGIIPLILSHKSNAEKIVGIEVQEGSFDRATRNAQLNSLCQRVSFINMDVKDIEEKDSLKGQFSLVTTNPPYTQGNGGIINTNSAKAIARHETTASLDDFLKAAAFLLKDRGDFAMIHRPSRIVDICCSCRKHKLEPKEIQFISPRIGEAPNLMLIHCVKNGGKNLNILDPAYVYDGAEYSMFIKNIY